MSGKRTEYGSTSLGVDDMVDGLSQLNMNSSHAPANDGLPSYAESINSPGSPLGPFATGSRPARGVRPGFRRSGSLSQSVLDNEYNNSMHQGGCAITFNEANDGPEVEVPGSPNDGSLKVRENKIYMTVKATIDLPANFCYPAQVHELPRLAGRKIAGGMIHCDGRLAFVVKVSHLEVFADNEKWHWKGVLAPGYTVSIVIDNNWVELAIYGEDYRNVRRQWWVKVSRD